MRIATLVVVLGLVVLGSVTFGALARGDEEAPGSAETALEKRVEVLEKQVAYLAAREADLTTYLLENQTRGDALQTMVKRMRQQGFQNAAIPPSSRETLMDGLEALGKAMATDVPEVTRAQAAMMRQAKVGR